MIAFFEVGDIPHLVHAGSEDLHQAGAGALTLEGGCRHRFDLPVVLVGIALRPGAHPAHRPQGSGETAQHECGEAKLLPAARPACAGGIMSQVPTVVPSALRAISMC